MKNKSNEPKKERIKVRISSSGSIKVVNEDEYFARIDEQIREMKKRAAERAAANATTEAAENSPAEKSEASDAGQSSEERP